MSIELINIWYIVAAALFIFGLKQLGSPATAVRDALSPAMQTHVQSELRLDLARQKEQRGVPSASVGRRKAWAAPAHAGAHPVAMPRDPPRSRGRSGSDPRALSPWHADMPRAAQREVLPRAPRPHHVVPPRSGAVPRRYARARARRSRSSRRSRRSACRSP